MLQAACLIIVATLLAIITIVWNLTTPILDTVSQRNKNIAVLANHFGNLTFDDGKQSDIYRSSGGSRSATAKKTNSSNTKTTMTTAKSHSGGTGRTGATTRTQSGETGETGETGATTVDHDTMLHRHLDDAIAAAARRHRSLSTAEGKQRLDHGRVDDNRQSTSSTSKTGGPNHHQRDARRTKLDGKYSKTASRSRTSPSGTTTKSRTAASHGRSTPHWSVVWSRGHNRSRSRSHSRSTKRSRKQRDETKTENRKGGKNVQTTTHDKGGKVMAKKHVDDKFNNLEDIQKHLDAFREEMRRSSEDRLIHLRNNVLAEQLIQVDEELAARRDKRRRDDQQAADIEDQHDDKVISTTT